MTGLANGSASNQPPETARLHLRQQHLVDDMDDAVRLVDVGDGDDGRVAVLVFDQ